MTHDDPPSDQARRERELRTLLRAGGVRSVYQPIVELDTGAVVGYEALARDPAGAPLGLFGTEADDELLAELDDACLRAALDGASDAALPDDYLLFVNVEPGRVVVGPDDAEPPERRVAVEVTERDLARRPGELLAAVERWRRRGHLIALDDVGAHVSSLAFMPLVRPDVVKLDLRLVQAQPSPEAAEIMHAVAAYTEASGALVVAEGVETAAHRRTAHALGATLAQGYLYGQPGALARGLPRRTPLETRRSEPTPGGATPFEIVQRARPVRAADERLLLEVSLSLEEKAAGLGEPAVVVSAFQTGERFTARTIERYERLARSTAFVAALGVGMESSPAVGVRGAALAADDPLSGEWSVVVLAPHFLAALVGRELEGHGAERRQQRRFDFALTYDRDLVAACGQSLLARVIGG